MFGTRTLLTLLFATTVLTAGPADQESPLETELESYELLAEFPARQLGSVVRFAFTLEGEVESWNPYLTRFGTSQWACVRGWDDTSFPWLAEQYDNPPVRLFLPRNSSTMRLATSGRIYARYAVEGVVREYLGGQPWIEVTAIQALEAKLNEGTVIHAERALREMRDRQYTHATENLERASVGVLPPASARELERLLAECRAAQDATDVER